MIPSCAGAAVLVVFVVEFTVAVAVVTVDVFVEISPTADAIKWYI